MRPLHDRKTGKISCRARVLKPEKYCSERAQLLAAMTHPSKVLTLDIKQSFVASKSYVYIYIYIKCKLDVRKTVLNTWK